MEIKMMKKIKFNGLVVKVVLSASLLTITGVTSVLANTAETVQTQAMQPSSKIKNTRIEHVYRNHPIDNNIRPNEDTYKKPADGSQKVPSLINKAASATSDISAVAVVCGSWSTSGNALLNTIKNGGLSCIDSLFTSVPSGAFTETNIITVANEARYRGQIYNGIDTDEYLTSLHYWIRAFYYQGNRANLTIANQAATKQAMDALFANSHFYDKTAAHAKLVDFAVPNVNSASIAEQYVTTVRNLLNRYDQSFEDVPKWGNAMANITWNVLNECARLATCRGTNHTTTLINEISHYIHNNISWLDHPERDYHLHNLAYQLANIHAGKNEAHYTNIKSTLEARVNRIFTDFGYLKESTGRKAYMLAMSAVNYNQVCDIYNLCAKKDEIITAVLKDRITCPSGTLYLWAQDMNQAQRNWACSSLSSHESYFHSTMQTNENPVTPDDNEKLRMVVFNDSTEWSVYGGALFGASTDNGGLYLEGDPSVAGDQATFFAYEDVPARPTFDIWNLRHEYIHYLDGRFNTQGDFGDVNANGTGKTVWYGEGIAEFISRKSCNSEAATAASDSTYDISTIFGNEYGVGQTRIYPWGYLAVRYMYEQQNSTFFNMLNKFRQGDYTSYKSTMVDNWVNSKTYDNGFKAWLPSVTSSGCVVDTTRPPSPIEPVDLDNVQGTDQVGINACFSGATREDNTLEAGVAVCLKDADNNGFISLGISVKSGVVADMQVTLRNGSGDPDMLHKAGGHPSETVFDYSSATSTSSDETILVKNVQAGWNYIRVTGKPSFTNVTALARYLPTTGSSNVAPTANANGPYSAEVNTGIAFNSNGSVDSDGSIASYNWNFGDGSTASTSANPNHAYTTAGNFTATLTVTDNEGATASSTASVTIKGDPILTYCTVTGGGTHEWIAGVAIGELNNTSAQDNYKRYNLTASLTSGSNIITLTPGFSNGSYTEHWAVWIDYNADGDFTDAGEQVVSGLSSQTAVTATITPPSSAAGVTTQMRVAMKYNQAVTNSCTNITSGEVEDYTVIIGGTGPNNNAPVASTDGPYSAIVGTGIAMSSNSSSDSDGTIVSRSWNFGDGTSISTSTNPNHTYANAGVFTITLTVTDDDGATHTTSTTATITDVIVGPGNLGNVCTTQGPSSGNNFTAGTTICVPTTTNSNGIHYYYVLVPAGTSSITIESGHGTGNGDLYYNPGTWASSSSYTQNSTNAVNAESITVNNPAQGYRFFSVVGARSDMALKVDLN
jgi:microbial collagenase